MSNTNWCFVFHASLLKTNNFKTAKCELHFDGGNQEGTFILGTNYECQPTGLNTVTVQLQTNSGAFKLSHCTKSLLTQGSVEKQGFYSDVCTLVWVMFSSRYAIVCS